MKVRYFMKKNVLELRDCVLAPVSVKLSKVGDFELMALFPDEEFSLELELFKEIIAKDLITSKSKFSFDPVLLFSIQTFYVIHFL